MVPRDANSSSLIFAIKANTFRLTHKIILVSIVKLYGKFLLSFAAVDKMSHRM